MSHEPMEVTPEVHRVFVGTLAFGLVLFVGYAGSVVTAQGSAMGYVLGATSGFLALFVCIEALDVLESEER